MSSEYQDRLDGHDDIDSLLDAAQGIVAEMAAAHYDHCYDVPQCELCAADKPVDGPPGPWLRLKDEFDDFVSTVEDQIRDMGEDIDGVAPMLRGDYSQGFDDAAVDPNDCLVCTQEVTDSDDPCGHEIFGKPCPAR